VVFTCILCMYVCESDVRRRCDVNGVELCVLKSTPVLAQLLNAAQLRAGVEGHCAEGRQLCLVTIWTCGC